MWGLISTEASYSTNFNTGFSSTRSDVLVHLAQWQYWWWFWFAFLWSLYYLIFLRVFRFRMLKMRPKIVTSFRPHGKWGDFLAAIIPAIWCLNILTNSNFILRLVEWQSESSLFTIRVRGRQWYWVYKYELKAIMEVLTTPKNVGKGKWFFSVFGDLSVEENYLRSLKIRRNNQWTKDFWQKSNQKLDVISNDTSYFLNSVLSIQNLINKKKKLNYFFLKLSDIKKKNTLNRVNSDILINKNLNFLILNSKKNETAVFYNNSFYQNKEKMFFNAFTNFLFLNPNQSYYKINKSRNLSELSEISAPLKKNNALAAPIRIIKTALKYNEPALQKNSKNILFNTSFSDGIQNIKEKNYGDSTYLVIKQKRYSIKNRLKPVLIQNKNKLIKFSGRSILFDNKIFDDFFKKTTSIHKILKKNKNKNDMMFSPLSKRLLRTKRTLVLPAHINITVVTNSFDVVHSWYIPGLGVKLDCVPGRSTHHTFFVDNIGFYFGQCAEICGRFHHHMPIRICALPFEHFLVWWNSFGISKVAFLDMSLEKKKKYSFYKYNW